MKSVALFALVLAVSGPLLSAQDTETIVCFRHGEKPPVEIGQLDAQGLNRALALPDVLIAHYGKPAYLFAPDPAQDLAGGKNGQPYVDYIRPLATIEPTAIKLGMPVNTTFGFKHIAALETELLKPQYHSALIYLCWEHHLLADFLQKISTDVNHQAAPPVNWPNADYDSIYVIKIAYGSAGTTLAISNDQEGLNGQSSTFPSPAK